MLVDVVSAGGNLLLITNLTGTGKLDPLLVERLRAMGAWLEVNGEAIYATRQWKHFKEGEDIRFTQSKDGTYVYAISLRWPGHSLVLQSLRAKRGSNITMLGVKDPLTWRQDDKSIVIAIPGAVSANRPCDFGWSFRIQSKLK